MDRTRTRWGRYRPWLAAGAPILMAGVYLLFMARPGVGAGYLLAALGVVYLGFSILVVGHFAWASTLSAAYDGRSRVFAWLQGVVIIGVLFALALPAGLAALAGAGSAAGVRAMGWLIIAATPITLALALGAVRERPDAQPAPHAGLGDYVKLLKNPDLLRLLGLDLALLTAAQVNGVLFFFYFEQVKHFTKGQAGILLLAYFLGALAGAPLWLALARRFGKHGALAIAAAAYIVVQGVVLVLPAGALVLDLLPVALAGAPYAAEGVLVRAMLADVADSQRLSGGADRVSLLYALQIGGTKLAAAFAVGLTFMLLAMAGFSARAGAINSSAALSGLTWLFAGLPAVLSLLAAGLCVGYPLTAERHAEIRRGLAALDAPNDPPAA
jgi:Na+/melibiose symporter-like transporter